MIKENYKGSLTVFAALSIMIISQFLFTMLEVARYQEMNKITEMNANSEIEYVFAEYNRPLWDKYHFLIYDGVDSDIEEQLKELTRNNFSVPDSFIGGTPVNILRANLVEVGRDKISLPTDQAGEVFRAQIASYMKENIGYEAAKKLYSRYKSVKNVNDNGAYDESEIDNAISALENPEEPDSTSKKQHILTKATSNDNQLEVTSEATKKGVLSLVMMDHMKLSGKKVDFSNSLTKRKVLEGNYKDTLSSGWYEDILMQQYLLTYMSSFTNQISGRALNYELEYILAGKDSDEENLKKTVEEILAIREAANLMYLYSDAGKVAEAYSLAVAIAGATANPAIIEAVKVGLLVAWAYCESIMDLRALLDGDKIPIMKTYDTWTSSLGNIDSLLSGSAKAKSSQLGITYLDYVGTLIMMKSEKNVNYRALDVMEKTVQMEEGYSMVQMDKLISRMKLTMKYEYRPIFVSFVSLLNEEKDSINIIKSPEYEYFK